MAQSATVCVSLWRAHGRKSTFLGIDWRVTITLYAFLLAVHSITILLRTSADPRVGFPWFLYFLSFNSFLFSSLFCIHFLSLSAPLPSLDQRERNTRISASELNAAAAAANTAAFKWGILMPQHVQRWRRSESAFPVEKKNHHLVLSVQYILVVR